MNKQTKEETHQEDKTFGNNGKCSQVERCEEEIEDKGQSASKESSYEMCSEEEG